MSGVMRIAHVNTLLMTVIGLVVLGSHTAAGEVCQDLAAKVRAERQKQQAATQQFLAQMQLSRAQARRLIPLVEQAAEMYLESYHQQAELLPEIIEAYTAFAQEDRRNQGFSQEVDRRTARLHHREIMLRENQSRRLIELEKEAARVLNSSQRATAETFRPGRRPSFAAENRRAGRHRRRQPNADQQRLSSARDELRQIRRHRHPRAGNLGRYLMQPAAFTSLYQMAGRQPSRTVRQALEAYQEGTSSCSREEYEQQRAQLRELHGEINNWNLINGLHMSQEQIGRIVGLYESTVPSRFLMGDERPVRPRGHMLLALEHSVEDILNPGQLAVLAEYKPCLLPPKNLRDPVRIGQANDNSGHEKWLSKARTLSGKRLNRAVDRCLEREEKHLGRMTSAERGQRRSLLKRTARQSARLSDTDFELSKSELAERIAPPDHEQELNQTISTLTRQLNRPGRIARMLLKPDFIEQLRERGQQLAGGVTPESANLAAEPQAENCDHSCAINPKKKKPYSLMKTLVTKSGEE